MKKQTKPFKAVDYIFTPGDLWTATKKLFYVPQKQYIGDQPRRIGKFVFVPEKGMFGIFGWMLRVTSKVNIRNLFGIGLLAAAVWLLHFGLHFSAEGVIFWLFALTLFYWKLDSRISIGLALAGLVLIPILLALGNKLILPSGEELAEKVAVWVYYFLVIGVAKQIWENRGGKF
jgi:hypothetical protein